MVLLSVASFKNAAFCNAAFCLTAVHASFCLQMAFLRILHRESHWLTFCIGAGWSCRDWLSCWDWLQVCHIAAISCNIYRLACDDCSSLQYLISIDLVDSVFVLPWTCLLWQCRACHFGKEVLTWWKSFHILCTCLVSSHPRILRNRRLSRKLMYYRWIPHHANMDESTRNTKKVRSDQCDENDSVKDLDPRRLFVYPFR